MGKVAPLAGAWIEIGKVWDFAMEGAKVAPLAGAWIEILCGLYHGQKSYRSLPSRERGLKFELIGVRRANDKRRSPRGSVD